MNYQKAYYELLNKFGEWELISPTQFTVLNEMAEGKRELDCGKFTAGGGRNVCRLLIRIKNLDYILLSEHEKEIRILLKQRARLYDEIAELKKMLAAMAKRLPIPKNVKMVKLKQRGR